MGKNQHGVDGLTSADLSKEQIEKGIRRLEEMIIKVERILPFDSVMNINIHSVLGSGGSFSAEVEGLEKEIDRVLTNIFSRNTIEFNRYKGATHIITVAAYDESELFNSVKREKPRIIELLNQAKQDLEERLATYEEDSTSRTLRAYENFDLHPVIENAASQLYKNGHYANAIEDAVKALNNHVRLKSGEMKDGVSLMQKVFSQKNPVLMFNDLNDESDRDEQKGFMDLFCGAVSGLRNPRAHKIIQDDPERALEFIAFISLLAKLTDEAKKTEIPEPIKKSP